MRDIPTSSRIIEIKHNRRARRLRLIILFFILFISIIVALSHFSSHPRIVINKIIVTGNSIIDADDVESHVSNDLNGKYIHLFSRSNFLIYPHNKIYNKLIADFPRIENLLIKREGLNTLRIFIKERIGSYLYCGITMPENKEDVGENCYFVNNDGYIFDSAPYFSGDVYFKYYTKIIIDSTGDSTNPTGHQMFLPSRFHELMRFVDGITSLGFRPSYLIVSNNGLSSLYLKSQGVNPNPKILFKEDNDLVNILDNFSIAMSKKEFRDEINSKYDMLSYIDLRFKNKVLYKFQ